jgi:hypothetical protein
MQRDICACLCEGDGDARAKTLCRTGNQRVFAFKTKEIENSHDIAPFVENEIVL